MIISDKHKFIFLHVPKVAGSSIAVYLSQFLGDDDLMLDAWNDALMHKIPYNKRVYREINTPYGLEMISKALSLREKDGKLLERPVLDYALRKVIGKQLKIESVHAPASYVKEFSQDKWDDYFKFAFVRNPYSHAVSFWRWSESAWSLKAGCKNALYDNKDNGSFREFLQNIKTKGAGIASPVKEDRSFLIPGHQIYTLDGEICVDFVGRFENLKSDMDYIHSMLGLPSPSVEFPHTKKNSQISIENIYDDETKKLVEDIWEPIFQLFDYEFPSK
jgi:hypothetical protein